VITISRRGAVEVLAGASALTALETCHRVPRECSTGYTLRTKCGISKGISSESSTKPLYSPFSYQGDW
jgi:hypothetical protein